MADYNEAKPANYYNQARPEIVAVCGDIKGKRILDVGCGAGAMGAALLDAGAAVVAGIEREGEPADLARKRGLEVHAFDLDGPWPVIHALRFDVIVCADVLEHLRDPDRVLRYVRFLLADKGRLIVSLPNVRHASVLLPLLLDGLWNYQPAGILDRDHLRFFTAASAVGLLENGGFTVEQPIGAVIDDGLGVLGDDREEFLLYAVRKLGGNSVQLENEAAIIQFILTGRLP